MNTDEKEFSIALQKIRTPQMSEDNIKKTIEILSKAVSKTPLNQKLLSKPPFRYLHDLISEVIRTTGAFSDLYNSTEQNSENVKDKVWLNHLNKESKVAFLQKLMAAVASSSGVEIRLNPLKVVAGLEPDETNSFLQLFGIFISHINRE